MAADPVAEPPPAEPAAAPIVRLEVVAGRGDLEPPDPGERRRAERRATEARLADVARRAGLTHLPNWGLVIGSAGLFVAGVVFGADPVSALLFVIWVALAAGAVAVLPRRLQQQHGRPGAWPTATAIRWLVGGATFAMAALPWGTLTLSQPLEPLRAAAAAAALVALAGAATLSPLPGITSLLVAVPMSAAAAAALDGQWLLAAFGALSAAVAFGTSSQRRRSWRQNTRALIEQGDRIRDLEAERDDAARADQDKSRFLAIASHDLRQPVHAIALFTATLHKRLHGSPEEPLVRNMVRALDGLERSFNTLLDVSRLDAGSLVPTPQTFALRDVFRRLHMHYGGQAELAGLGLRFSPGGRSVHSDPQLLERILGNLIQNAIKYTENGGIVVVARGAGETTHIEVWDTGNGIDPKELPRIFDEFYQVGRPERDRSHGLGMGLAIVKRLCSLLGHSLTVSSRPGKGTMFRVGITIGALPGIQETMVPADTVPMQATTPKMVLVIDDEEPIREGLRMLLHEWGYQSIVAADSTQAEEAAAALDGQVDLILSDLHLGEGEDGLDAIDNVRRLCRKTVPAILITGDTSGDEMRRVAASGHPVLFKPMQPRRLFEVLSSLLG